MKVAVAIIFDQEQRVLITRRPVHAAHGGMWEFPGGKLEANELPEQALIREIKEEVGIDILDYRFLTEVTHSYDAQVVHLLVFIITCYEGKPSCRESQLALHWVGIEDLDNYQFPEANIEIIELIRMDCKQSESVL
ncbi:8-oxo-dGTP diphosphatase MutT [Legionella feeleii]|uniref:8-oxo-dGTP diphosphatase n=1 Tax=Legionella feeleii TaxID=453 RepID=A0A0W0TI74_9GAMM|nr:8-oxo-dGTP diphosphatase MutT [Legionella feeleii]KTC95286.1 Mutator protein MutT [Legionella feeleii]SPX59669.1 Mutator protein MutT [Legionella feeleii]